MNGKNTKCRKLADDAAFIRQFAIDDFKTKYAGSALGGLWAFLQPIITIILYWFVFQLGFKSQPVDDFPFILWLMIGLIPWFFISDAIVNATASLLDYSYLVKKVLFNINILPLAKVLSTFFVQLVLILFALVCFTVSGYPPRAGYLQVLIYLLYMFLLVVGISYTTATLYVFFKDTMQIISIVIQAVFWLTPIVWDIAAMPVPVQRALRFNPMYYCISGFRSAFIEKGWNHPGIGMTLYYWTLCLLVLLFGIRLFGRCKDHFADVL